MTVEGAEFTGFGYEELLDEIRREEGVLADLEARLTELQRAEAETRERIVRERDPRLWERRRARAETIRALELDIAERARKIRDLQEAIKRNEARYPRVSAVERSLIRRVNTFLRRTISSYRGWQTRKERTLRSLRGWQTRELALEPRLKELYATLAHWTREISLLTARITAEKAKLERKKEELKKQYQHKIIVCNIRTERAGILITISITLWFDVRLDVMEHYLKEAIAKIHRWLDASFYGNISGIPEQLKLSEEEKQPNPKVLAELKEKGAEVSDIHYKFYWSRTRRGVLDKEEEGEGDITWEEDVPLTSRAGARRGKRRE